MGTEAGARPLGSRHLHKLERVVETEEMMDFPWIFYGVFMVLFVDVYWFLWTFTDFYGFVGFTF